MLRILAIFYKLLVVNMYELVDIRIFAIFMTKTFILKNN